MKTRSNILVVVSILILAAVIVYSLDRYGRNSRVYRATGLIDAPQVVKRVVATPNDAYLAWKQSGVRGRTTLFIVDAWEKLDIADTPPIPMSRPYPLKPFSIPEWYGRQIISQANILFIASMNGIVRQVVAILSPEGFADRLTVARDSIDKKIGDNTIYLPHQGFPRWFTTVSGFSGEHEPVLVYVGASIFRSTEPEELFRKLKETRLETDLVVLCLMEGNNQVTAIEREKLLHFARLVGIAPANIAGVPAASALPR
jgi:hypothetical protein